MAAIQTSEGLISCGDHHANNGRKVFVNGKSVILLGDLSEGHNGFPPTASIEASSNVFAYGVPMVRSGDRYAPHSNHGTTHTDRRGIQETNVFANGR